jgi:Tol biopolymer transport system component
MNANGSDVRQLTTDYGTQPLWSPDGTTIAFVSHRSADNYEPAIHLMNADGTNRRLLPVTADAGQGSKWSPTAQRIAFVDVNIVSGPSGSERTTGRSTWLPLTAATCGA